MCVYVCVCMCHFQRTPACSIVSIFCAAPDIHEAFNKIRFVIFLKKLSFKNLFESQHTYTYRERERSIFHVLLYFQNALNGHAEAMSLALNLVVQHG